MFDDDAGVMNRSASDVGAEILVVSQFTLYGDTSAGRRPSWIAAARPDQAEPLVEHVVATLVDLGATVATGRFRAEMQVSLVNDGPVTVLLDSPPTSVAPNPAIITRMTGPSPRRVYHVSPLRNSTSRRITARSLTAVRWCTSPSGVTNAENPVGAACTTQRPVSRARSRLEAICCVCTIVPE